MSSYSPDDGHIVHTFQYPLAYDYIDIDVGLSAWWGGLFREDHFGAVEVALGLTTILRDDVTRMAL
jgi:hypothetical protein